MQLRLALVLIGATICACGRSRPMGQRVSLGSAYCQAAVGGAGVVDVESNYLPKVVNCENGRAGFEALKAQAVAARSYLYYRLDRDGTIGDSPRDQVYSCTRPMNPLVYRAVRETSGQVLIYSRTQVAGFYVAGALQKPPACTLGKRDPTATEGYVTYNRGKRGDKVTKTRLGWIHPDNHANRGCMSQNGASCLAKAGWSYLDILRFYYGMDIEIVQVQGQCIKPYRSETAAF